MLTVCLKPLHHRQKENIAICYPNDGALNSVVRKLKGVKWSQSKKCWYLPLTEASYKAINDALNSLAAVDSSLLKQYLQKKKQVQETVVSSGQTSNFKPQTSNVLSPAWKLNKENLEELRKFVEQLKLKAYSSSTVKTYRGEFLQLLQLLKKKPVYELTPADLRRYMVYAMEKQGINENTAHSRLNALKFYFEQVLGREKFFWEIPRPKKPQVLPKLLNEKELANLFNALQNKKHKAMLFTAYSAGLRVSEIVNLKIADIDSKRMQIFIERAKGKKDRYVNLSPVLLDILRSYLKIYTPRPKLFLFESDYTGKAYPTRTVQQIFSNAKEKAGINKEVGIHSLRHSFATHLLEKGTDIRYIKELLGHFNIKTTERYLHVARQKLVNIISPLDDLIGKEKIDW
jgi:site-specific recombinase XerD